MPSFGEWAAPASLESIPGSSNSLNTTFVDGCASHSPDGLTIVFNSNRGGSQDLFMATRPSTSVGFGAPIPLPEPVNLTDRDEFCPTLARGNRLYFSSNRNGDPGDLFVTRRGPKGWSQPESLGANINSAAMEESAAFYEDDDGREVMLFSRRLGSAGGGKIYQSVDGGQPELVEGGPHSSAADNRPSVTHDGRTIFFDSTRPGSRGPDLWYATRSNTSEDFGDAIHLAALSEAGFDARPFISWNGKLLTFSSGRMGNESPAPDMWFTTRN